VALPSSGVWACECPMEATCGGVGQEGSSCPEDTDGDGQVDVNDLLQLLSAFGATSPGTEDVTGDGAVDVNDLLQLLSVRTATTPFRVPSTQTRN
jgi:hypothetical protein